jgi:demethylmenaquinone methyltransferase/2-methoxy-6-polyprenyl-1,4-benzoquinol methylase
MLMSSTLTTISNTILENPTAKRRYNQKLFSIVAPQYRRATVALSFGFDSSWKQRLVASLPRLDTGVIADIACGTGDVTALLDKAYTGCKVIGVDLSPGMLAAGRAQGNLPCALIQDMAALGLRDASCDVVTGCYALRNAPDIQSALREIRRICKDSGTAAFLDFSRSPNRVMAAVQYLLLYLWGSVWGIVLHGNPAVYAYIARSLMRFPGRNALRRQLGDAGFTVSKSRLFFGGMLELIVCRPTIGDGGGYVVSRHVAEATA